MKTPVVVEDGLYGLCLGDDTDQVHGTVAACASLLLFHIAASSFGPIYSIEVTFDHFDHFDHPVDT